MSRLAPQTSDSLHNTREHRRRRMRRRRRRAYIRSVHFLPSMATLGNAICGFGAIYIASDASSPQRLPDFHANNFVLSAYLIFAAMLFDAIDGRLARFARHTTDFGGQLDSLADVLSFGAAPAFLALTLFRESLRVSHVSIPMFLARLIWAVGVLYVSCALLRLARFNVSNRHGEQHHFSFLGLPSPAAAGAVAATVLMQQDLLRKSMAFSHRFPTLATACSTLSDTCILLLPIVVLLCGLLMTSQIRYPHIINRYLRGRRSIARLLAVLAMGLIFLVAHEETLAIGMLLYTLSGLVGWAYSHKRPTPPAAVIQPPQ